MTQQSSRISVQRHPIGLRRVHEGCLCFRKHALIMNIATGNAHRQKPTVKQ